MPLATVVGCPKLLLALPPLGGPVRSARLLRGGGAVRFQETSAGVTLELPPPGATDLDRIVAVVTGGAARR